jgi:hypothetical protein
MEEGSGGVGMLMSFFCQVASSACRHPHCLFSNPILPAAICTACSPVLPAVIVTTCSPVSLPYFSGLFFNFACYLYCLFSSIATIFPLPFLQFCLLLSLLHVLKFCPSPLSLVLQYCLLLFFLPVLQFCVKPSSLPVLQFCLPPWPLPVLPVRLRPLLMPLSQAAFCHPAFCHPKYFFYCPFSTYTST